MPTGDLFGAAPEPAGTGLAGGRHGTGSDAGAPLAERLRPRTLSDVVGQNAAAPDSLLRQLLASGRLPSLILWGPPGTGKTTLARILAAEVVAEFVPISAVLSGVKDIRAAIADAAARRDAPGARRTVLFIDEIHHFNKSQQDALLPHVEDGLITLVGATTENPSFSLNAALLSRCTVIVLDELSVEALTAIATRALRDPTAGLGAVGLTLAPETLHALAATSHGDARSMLNRLEALGLAAARRGGNRTVPHEEALKLLASRQLRYDRQGDEHYDLISALHKSVRGGDPQATLYYLARMIEGGEEPLYLGRRLVRMAVEDIGIADPPALRIALDAVETYKFLGSPEGDLALAAAAVYLATAPKSNTVYAAFDAVRADIRAGAVHQVPDALRNAPTKLMKDLGRGAGYQYPHDVDHAVVDQDYLPAALKGKTWYTPSPFGHEKEIARRLAWWADVRAKLRGEAPHV